MTYRLSPTGQAGFEFVPEKALEIYELRMYRQTAAQYMQARSKSTL